MIGKTISHSKVLEKIGQGGMGEVYRSEDTNLGREVAIKVLPEHFTQDPQRLARFEREAKLLASLDHPNILQPTQTKISGNFDCLFTPYRFSIEDNCIARGELA